MAIFLVNRPKEDVIIGIWKIEETPEDFYQNYPHLKKQSSLFSKKYKSEKRLKEVLAERALLFEVLKKEVHLFHDEKDCPHLSSGTNISISHTLGYVSIILSKTKKVAIDMEFLSERIKKVAHKFMLETEKAETTIELLLHWCAKETLYKLFPKDDLRFSQTRVIKISGNAFGEILVLNCKENLKVNLSYKVTQDFVLTWAII